MSDNTARRIVVKLLKIFGWLVLSVVGLLVLIALAIQLPWIQQLGKEKAISFLESKIGTTVRLARFSLSFPKKIVLSGIYFEDQKQDTLLYAGRFVVDTDLWSLMQRRIELKKITLEDFTSRISRAEKDSAFNFDYILQAFASDTVTEDTTSAPWDFVLGDVVLQNLRFSLQDKLSGNDIDLRLGELDVETDKFDLANEQIAFGRIDLRDVNANVRQTKIPEIVPDSVEAIPEDSAAVAFNVSFQEINLARINGAYSHTGLGQLIDVSFPEAIVQANSIDIKNQRIDLDRVMLRNSFVSFQQMAVAPKRQVVKEQEKNQDEPQEAWSFALSKLDLEGNTIQYHDHHHPAVTGALDFNHLWISGLNTRVTDIRFYENDIRANVNNFSFQEKSGFEVKSFRTAISVDENSIRVDDFIFSTGHSNLQFNASATFPALETLADRYPEASVQCDLATSTVGLRDLLYFNPALLDSIPVKASPATAISFDTRVHGNINDLTVERLRVRALDETQVVMNGNIKGIPDMDNAVMNLVLSKFYTTRTDIQSLLADSLLPQSIAIPQWINLAGSVQGTIHTPRVQTQLTTDYGSADLVADVDMKPGRKARYAGEVNINTFQLGTLLKQPETIGKLDMRARVNGSGVAMEELDARVNLIVRKVEYNGYTYRDFNLNGSIKQYFFSGTASLQDENLDFKLTGDLDYRQDVPAYGFVFDLNNADFEKLNLAQRPLKVKGKLEVDLETADFKAVNGNVGIRDFGVYNGQALYAVDSFLIASIDQEGQSEISIRSDIISGDFKGSINIFSLPDLLTRHFNHYFSLRDTVYATPVEDQKFEFNLVLKNTDLITEVLLPGLEPFVPGEIAGNFDSREDQLNLTFNLAGINYTGVAIDSVLLTVLSDERSFDFTFELKDIRYDTMRVSGMRLAGNVMHDSIRTNFMIVDSLNREKYFLGGVFNSFKDVFQFRFLQNHLTLNYEAWDTPLYNTLQFSEAGLEPNNFYISKGKERILLLKKNNRDSTLSVVFNDVDLKNITSLVEGTTPLSGIIDGDLNMGAASSGAFQTDLRIKNLGILEQEWGDLIFLLAKQPQRPTTFDLTVEGEDALLKAEGSVTDEAEPEIQLNASIPRLNLAVLEPLTVGQLKNMKGLLSATFAMRGPVKDPDMSGRITFKEVSFLATYVNSVFMINEETISLQGTSLRLNDFDILDAKNNTATIDGTIVSAPTGGFNLDLKLETRSFQLLNTTEEDNDMFYGNVRINTDATIKGSSLQPNVQVDLSLEENSTLTYIVPQSEQGVMEQRGIVVFVDKDAVNDPFMADINAKDTVKTSFTGINLVANVELSDGETFNIIIDPATGDRLSVKGNATLTLTMDPSGDMQLSGRYEITEGTYDLSFYKLVKRNFSIVKGSTIVWSGDPLNADMDISAMHEVETSPVELVANQVSDNELNVYKQRLPFQVYLQIEGELLSPQIGFRLDMPENERNAFGGNIYAKLQDINTRESDLNKQVFALLILRRFISDNPFDNQAGSGVEGSARRSVSRLLSEQLNRLSDNVKGVELSFDLKSYEDYSSGQAEGQTELELGLSKNLLNDRLIVKVTGNVDLEGETSNQDSFSDFIGDLALEYKLTEDGRFRITGFRNSNYDMIDGELIETGAGLIYIKDYDTLKELFKSNETGDPGGKGE